MFEMICRVFKIAGNSRRKIVAGIVCNILKSFFNGFMMFGVFWILLHLMDSPRHHRAGFWRNSGQCAGPLLFPVDV